MDKLKAVIAKKKHNYQQEKASYIILEILASC